MSKKNKKKKKERGYDVFLGHSLYGEGKKRPVIIPTPEDFRKQNPELAKLMEEQGIKIASGISSVNHNDEKYEITKADTREVNLNYPAYADRTMTKITKRQIRRKIGYVKRNSPLYRVIYNSVLEFFGLKKKEQ